MDLHHWSPVFIMYAAALFAVSSLVRLSPEAQRTRLPLDVVDHTALQFVSALKADTDSCQRVAAQGHRGQGLAGSLVCILLT